MTDHDWVRRLLAEEGRADEPMPPEVADRLDRVLADLAEERRAPAVPDPAPPVPMTPRRHRRWGSALLAAAAVTIGGYTVTATGLLGQSQDAGSESAADSETAGSAQAESAPEADAGGERPGGPPSLSSQTLERDALRLVRERSVASKGYRSSSPGADGEMTDQLRDMRAASGVCVPPPARVRGSRVSVRFDGEPATAVVAGSDAGRVLVQVWSCESSVRLARVSVAPPER